MSNILEQLRALRRPKKTKVVSPAIEFVHKKRATTTSRKWVFWGVLLSTFFIGAGIVLLIFTGRLSLRSSEKEVPAIHKQQINRASKEVNRAVSEYQKPDKNNVTFSQSANKRNFDKTEKVSSSSVKKINQRNRLHRKKKSFVVRKKRTSHIQKRTNQLRSTINALLYRGRTLEQEARYTKALEYYIKAASLDPANKEIARKIGLLYLSLGQCDKATMYLKRQIKWSEEPDILINLGVCEMRRGRLDRAEEALRGAVEKGGAGPVIYYNLGMLMYKKGRYEEAENYLDDAISSARGSLRMKCLILFAAVKEAKAQYNDALRLYLQLQKMKGLTPEQRQYVLSRLQALLALQGQHSRR